jgi:hypothetical protein
MNMIAWIIVGLMLVTSTVILINYDWRVSLGALGAQYLGVFFLSTQHLPFIMGAVKLIAGWMVVAVLGMTRLGLSGADNKSEETFLPRGQWFRVILVGVIALMAAGSTTRIEETIPGLGLQVVAGGLFLIGSGILQLGVTSDVLRITLGLLTMLAGFEIIYAAVESSVLVTGLLAVVNLGLGLTGSYLLISGAFTSEEYEEA